MRAGLIKACLVAAAVSFTSVANGATVMFNFGANPGGASGANWGSVGPSSTSGLAANAWDANARIFTATSGATTVKVRTTGWSIDGSTIQDSFLGGFTGAGLGVTSGDDYRGTNGRHAVDNQTRQDFILLQFDQLVQLHSATFNAIPINGVGYTDTDATIGRGRVLAPWNVQPGLNGQNVSALASLVPVANRYGSGNNGTSGSNTRGINPNNYVGNVWLISAALATHNGDAKIDSFKLNSLKVYTATGPLPEPATWAMMIIGFGFIGSAVRRSRKLATA